MTRMKVSCRRSSAVSRSPTYRRMKLKTGFLCRPSRSSKARTCPCWYWTIRSSSGASSSIAGSCARAAPKLKTLGVARECAMTVSDRLGDLTRWTEKRCPSLDHLPPDERPAARAWLALAPVDLQVVVVVTLAAVGVDEVLEAGPALVEGVLEDTPHRARQGARRRGVEPPGAPAGAQLRQPERLGRIDVADACQHGLIEEERLQRDRAAARFLVEPRAVDLLDDRVAPEHGERRMRAFLARAHDVDLPEPARIGEAELSAVVELRDEVRVRRR